VNSLHRLMNCEIGGLDCRVIRVQNLCPLYTHVTPILQCISPCYLFRSFRSIFLYNTQLNSLPYSMEILSWHGHISQEFNI